MPLGATKSTPRTTKGWLRKIQDLITEMSEIREKHSRVFKNYEALAEELEVANEQIKLCARKPFKNGHKRGEFLGARYKDQECVVVVKYSEQYDAEALLTAAPFLEKIPGLVKRTMDKKAVVAQIKAGALKQAVAAKALRRTFMTPAVSVRPIEQ